MNGWCRIAAAVDQLSPIEDGDDSYSSRFYADFGESGEQLSAARIYLYLYHIGLRRVSTQNLPCFQAFQPGAVGQQGVDHGTKPRGLRQKLRHGVSSR